MNGGNGALVFKIRQSAFVQSVGRRQASESRRSPNARGGWHHVWGFRYAAGPSCLVRSSVSRRIGKRTSAFGSQCGRPDADRPILGELKSEFGGSTSAFGQGRYRLVRSPQHGSNEACSDKPCRVTT